MNLLSHLLQWGRGNLQACHSASCLGPAFDSRLQHIFAFLHLSGLSAEYESGKHPQLTTSTMSVIVRKLLKPRGSPIDTQVQHDNHVKHLLGSLLDANLEKPTYATISREVLLYAKVVVDICQVIHNTIARGVFFQPMFS